MKKRLLFLAFISIFALSACDKVGKEAEKPKAESALQEDAKRVEEMPESAVLPEASDDAWVDANNQLGLKFLRNAPIGESFVASPFSMQRALGMTLDGAAGHTAKEMRTALDLPEASELSAAGSRIEAKILKTISDDDSVVVRVVNRLWLEQTYTLDPNFLANAKRDYHAEPTLLDFVKASEASRVTINTAIAEATNDKIDELIPKGEIDANTRLVLTNAIYFKSPWLKPFKKEETEEAEFASPNGPVTVDMMHMTERLPLYQGEAFSALTLAYFGSSHAMVILLPETMAIDDLAKIEAKLDAQSIRNILEKSQKTRVAVALPRFKIERDISLKSVLQSFGMHDAFSLSKANFSRMSPMKDLYISAAFHSAIVEVDEIGTQAAAATAVIMGARGIIMPDNDAPQPFVADHPFTYMLVETDSMAVVFIGRFVGK